MAFGLETGPDTVVNIKVIGVGGGGNNVVNRMVRSGTKGVEFVAVNTDKQALNVSSATYKIQIGEKLTKGLGAGAKPEVGEKAAEESVEELKQVMEALTWYLLPVVWAAEQEPVQLRLLQRFPRNWESLRSVFVTKPFIFEGKPRMNNALSGIERLKENVDTLIIIPNDKLLQICDKRTSIKDAFCKADEVLQQGVQGITDLIFKPGLINLDFADIQTVMRDKGIAHIGIGVGSGEDKAVDAIKSAMESPLLETTVQWSYRHYYQLLW